MNNHPKLLSLFDGSGGFPLAASMCGFIPAMASEIEPYPIAVTRSRFPQMKHLGSVTDIHGNEIEPVDIFSFGSPCQDLSVAGARAGLQGSRSSLFLEAIRIIKEMREATHGVYPRFAIWENVCGAFSSHGGEDFHQVLNEFLHITAPEAEIPSAGKDGWSNADIYVGDGWSIAYRVFDARYWGVAQRRRRIYLVADFRGESAGKILFERAGLRRNFKESAKQREGIAKNTEGCFGTANEIENLNKGDFQSKTILSPNGIASSLYSGGDARKGGEMYVLDSIGGNAENAKETNVAPTLKATHYKFPPCIGVEMEVATRKYDVDKDKLKSVLLSAKGKKSNKEIAEALDQPETLVAHWFRQDDYFAIPTPETWLKLKELLQINTDEFDKSIMEYEFKGGNYDMRNRIYGGEVSPTLMSGSGNNLYLLNQNPSYGVPLNFRPENTNVYEETATTICNGTNPGHHQGVIINEDPTYTLKIRGGVDVDSKGKRAGKGAMITKNIANTLAVSQDQYLFHPVALDRYNQQTTEEVSPTLKAVNGGDDIHCVVVENHPADSRCNIDDSGTVQTLTGRMGTGGNNVPLIMQDAYCIGNGQVNDACQMDKETCKTLNCMDDPMKVLAYEDDVYSTSKASYHTEVSKDVANTLVATDYKDPPTVVYSKTSRAKTKDDASTWKESNTANTLNTFDLGEVRTNELVCDSAAVDCRNATEDTINGSLQARACGNLNSNNVCRQGYVVRRLTPTECCRLQGFPDGWGDIDAKDEFTGEEYEFWSAIHPGKREAVLKWYNKLHTDSAEYKMWGNGIALPCALYVMEGIEDQLKKESVCETDSHSHL